MLEPIEETPKEVDGKDRAWSLVRWGKDKAVILGDRNDGQKFFVKRGEAGRSDEELRAMLDSFLDPRCTCRIPPTEERCPVEASGFKHHRT